MGDYFLKYIPGAVVPAYGSPATLFAVDGPCVVEYIRAVVTVSGLVSDGSLDVVSGNGATLLSPDLSEEPVGFTLFSFGGNTVAGDGTPFVPFLLNSGVATWSSAGGTDTNVAEVEWYISWRPLEPGASIF